MNRPRLVRILFATSAAALFIGWTAYAAAIADAGRYHFYGEVWQFAVILGYGPAALGAGASLLASRRVALVFGVCCCIAAPLSFFSFFPFAGDIPRWAYNVIPGLTLWCAALGLVGAGRLRSRLASGAPSRTAP